MSFNTQLFQKSIKERITYTIGESNPFMFILAFSYYIPDMKKKIILIVIVLLIAVGAFYLYPILTETKVPYTTFVENRKDGIVTSATIYSDRITYTLASSDKTYSTPNPSSPTLKEELLLENIDVKEQTEDTFDKVSNIIVDIVFLAIFAFGGYKLISYSTKTFRVVRHTGVSFKDIAGMNDVKEEVLSSIKALDGGNGIRPVKGIILEGPPGNGKTLFARALAEECNVKFIAAKGADFQGALMGLGPFKVKMLFNKARRNKPCIIFIDEFDSIGEKRNYNGSGIDKENNRILTTLLNELDGFEPSEKILLIAATNSFESLDPALVRPGRFDLKFTIPNPDEKTREELVKLYLRSTPLLDSLTPQMLASLFNGLSAAAIETILNECRSLSLRKGSTGITKEILLEAARKTAIKVKVSQR